MRKTHIPQDEGVRLKKGGEGGEYRHGATWWAQWGLLQGVFASYVPFKGPFRSEEVIVLDPDTEWKPVRFDVQAIEHCLKGRADLLQFAVSGDDARKYGKHISTPRGPRWAILVQYWSKEAVPLMKCVPCAADQHEECVVDTGESLRTEPCSCSGQHGGRKKKIVKRRKVAG